MSILSTIIITAVVTAIIVFTIEEYIHAVVLPVDAEINPSIGFYEWQDFIKANINSCLHEDHCLQCTSLIHLFDRKFRPTASREYFSRRVEALWNQLNEKYESITHEQVELSDVTVAHLLKEKL